jgi:hypothetical protein
MHDDEMETDLSLPEGRAKELKLFTACLKKFIRKVFDHMVATRFASWRELAIQEQDGMVYPIYNYILDHDDPRCVTFYPGHGLELENGQILLADLSVSAILEEEGAIGLEFYLYETTSIVPFVCDRFDEIQDEQPSMSHFRRADDADFESLYDELKTSGLFDDIYYELNKSILLIELSERETLMDMKLDALRILAGVFSRAKSITNLSTIANTDIKECRLDFTWEGRHFAVVILNGHDAFNNPVYSSVMILPEYKSIAQYVDLDTWYEKMVKVLRAKNVETPEAVILDALRPLERPLTNRPISLEA